MKALLTTPSDSHAGFEYAYSGRENLGVEYLLAALRADGHEATSNNENIRGAGVNRRTWGEVDLIGFSLPFWEYREQYVTAINEVGEQSRAVLIAGGHAATLGAKYFLAKCPGLLGVVMGEGEETLCELAELVDIGENLHTATGIMFREVYKPRKVLKPLDALTFPARDELRLSLDSGGTVKEALVESTRGCTYRCSFCSIPPYYRHAHGKRWRERSVENVCAELTELLETFPEVDLISFTDDNFLGFNSRFHDRAVQIARHMRAVRPTIIFEIVCRVDAVEPEAFRDLASLGMVGVYLGIESGVQRVLDHFRKSTTVQQNLRALQILSELGVGCDVGFITFSPGMTLPEVRENLRFLRRIITDYPVFVHPAAVFRCLREYPTDLGESALEHDDGSSLSPITGPVAVLYERLEHTWHAEFEHDFLVRESTASSRGDDVLLLERQKAVTDAMLERAFWDLAELERSSSQCTVPLTIRPSGTRCPGAE